MDEKEKKIWKSILDNKNIHFLSRSDWNNISIENLIDWYDAEGWKKVFYIAELELIQMLNINLNIWK